jgi:glycosyltransferase involved in cell wall biosynthesis
MSMGKLKVFHVVESFGGGVFSSVSQLVNAMDPDRFECTVIHSIRSETPEDFESFFRKGTRFIHVPMTRELRPPQDLWSLVRLQRLFRRGRPDVVHLHSSKAGAIGRAAARLANVPKVFYSPRGFSFLRLDVSPSKRRLFEFFEKMPSRLGGTIVACSQGEYDEARRLGADVQLIPNAVDLALIDAATPRRLAPEGAFLVGTSGRISWQKNPELFHSIAKAFEDDERYAFVWIGDGERRDSLEQPGADITVTGWKSRKETLDLVAGLDVYVQTSLWEGMPISVLEAMALSKPAVVTRVVGNRDLVKLGENGFIAMEADEFVQALKLLRKDEGLRRSFGINARGMVEESHTVPVMVKKFEALYEGQGT